MLISFRFGTPMDNPEECPERIRLIMEYADASLAFSKANQLSSPNGSESALTLAQAAWNALQFHMSEHGCGLTPK
jgi:hypothetical protein